MLIRCKKNHRLENDKNKNIKETDNNIEKYFSSR